MNEAETQSERTFLKVQILEVQRLKEMVGDHPVMSVALAEREQELKERLAASGLETDADDPR